MIKIKQNINPNEESNINSLIDNILDLYSDFYITRDNLRLMITANKDLFLECLAKGDKVIWDEEIGILFVTGFSDKAKRIYIRPLCKDLKSVNKLVQSLNKNLPHYDLWIKIKKNNPIKHILLKKCNHFKYIASRGKEVLLCRQNLTNKKESDDAYKNN